MPYNTLAKSRAAHRKKRASNRAQIVDRLGARCALCGFSDLRALQIDHVNGDGAKERQAQCNTKAYLRYILKHLDSGRYQLLCANCNAIKAHKNSEWITSRVEARFGQGELLADHPPPRR